MARPEDQIKTAILELLSYIPGIFAWPNDSVGIYDPVRQVYRKKKSKYHINGVPDILGIIFGKPLAIEVKTPEGVVSKDQALFLVEYRLKGGIGFVARSTLDVTCAIDTVRQGFLPQADSKNLPRSVKLALGSLSDSFRTSSGLLLKHAEGVPRNKTGK